MTDRAEQSVCDSTYTERGFVYRCHRKGGHDFHLGAVSESEREWADEDADRG